VIGEKVVASNRILVGVLARTLARQRAAATDPEPVYFAARARLSAH